MKRPLTVSFPLCKKKDKFDKCFTVFYKCLLCFLNEMSYVRGSLCYELINGLILSFVVSLIVSVGVKTTGDGDFLLIDSWTLIMSYIEFEFYCKYIICSMLFVWTTQISFTDCLKHLQIIISNSLWKGAYPGH